MAGYERLGGGEGYELDRDNPDKAAGVNIEVVSEGATIFAKIAAYRKVSWIVGAATAIILLYGDDFAIVGTVSSTIPFQFGELYEGRYILPGPWLSAWSAASPLGAIVGSLTGGFVADRLGRRWTIMLGAAISIVGVPVSVVSNLPSTVEAARGLFPLSKLVNGFGVGIMMVTIQTYISEIVPTVLRGSAMTVVPIATLVGQLLGAAIITGVSGRFDDSRAHVVPLLTQFGFTLVPFAFAITAPESPTWLLRKGKFDAAIKANARICPPEVNPRLETMKQRRTIEEELARTRDGRAAYLDCFQGTDRRRTLIVLLAYCSPEFWGLSLLSNASYFLQVMGVEAALSMIVLLIGIVFGLFGNIASIWTISRFARRELIIYSFALAAVVWLTAGIANCFPSTGSNWYTIVALIAIITFMGMSSWPTFYAIGAETSSLRLRSATQGISWASGASASFVVSLILPLLYSPDAGNLKGRTAFVYAALSAVCLGLSWFFVPEMRNRAPHDIDRMFELGLSARDSQLRKDGESLNGMKVEQI